MLPHKRPGNAVTPFPTSCTCDTVQGCGSVPCHGHATDGSVDQFHAYRNPQYRYALTDTDARYDILQQGGPIDPFSAGYDFGPPREPLCQCFANRPRNSSRPYYGDKNCSHSHQSRPTDPSPMNTPSSGLSFNSTPPSKLTFSPPGLKTRNDTRVKGKDTASELKPVAESNKDRDRDGSSPNDAA